LAVFAGKEAKKGENEEKTGHFGVFWLFFTPTVLLGG